MDGFRRLRSGNTYLVMSGADGMCIHLHGLKKRAASVRNSMAQPLLMEVSCSGPVGKKRN